MKAGNKIYEAATGDELVYVLRMFRKGNNNPLKRSREILNHYPLPIYVRIEGGGEVGFDTSKAYYTKQGYRIYRVKTIQWKIFYEKITESTV